MSKINCIGFIMDGNRRWAEEQGIPTVEGHKKGFDVFKKVIEWGKDTGIKNVIFYAFSTENWKRSAEEINYLMKLFEETASESLKIAKKNSVRIRFLGQVERLPKKLQEKIKRIEHETKDFKKGTVGIAMSYGGRADIVQATNKLLEKGNKNITEEDFGKELWTYDMPDPDLIIRTGEVMRLSNFLTWQSAYSELYFTATLWPDFDKEEFDYILESFDEENRRKGK